MANIHYYVVHQAYLEEVSGSSTPRLVVPISPYRGSIPLSGTCGVTDAVFPDPPPKRRPSTRSGRPRCEIFRKGFTWGLPKRKKRNSSGSGRVSPKTVDEEQCELARADTHEPHPGRRLDLGDDADGDMEEENKVHDPNSPTTHYFRREGQSSPTQGAFPRGLRASTRGVMYRDGADTMEDMLIFSAGPDSPRRTSPPQFQTRIQSPGETTLEKHEPIYRLYETYPPEPQPGSVSSSSSSTPPSLERGDSSSSDSSVEVCITRIRESMAFRRSESLKKHDRAQYNMFKNEVEAGWALCDEEVLESSLH